MVEWFFARRGGGLEDYNQIPQSSSSFYFLPSDWAGTEGSIVPN